MEKECRESGCMSILCVEDDPLCRKTIINSIRIEFPELEVHSADNGRDALELFRRHRPEIVLADVGLPLINGIELAAEIRSLGPRTKIVLLTGVSDARYMQDAIQVGVTRYLLKPFDQLLFRETIRDCIEQVARAEEYRAAQAALLTSETRYRNLFSSMREAFALLVPASDGSAGAYEIVEANPAFGRLVRELPEALVGKALDSIFPLDRDYLNERLDKVAREGGRVPVDYHSHSFRREFEGEIYSPAAGELVVILWDVTESRIFQEEREKAQRLESLGTLAGGIAHDFNNILTAIIGNISLARRHVGPDHKADLRLSRCEEALKRATDLTQQLLTFARGGEPQKRVVDAAELVRNAASLALSGSNCTASFTFAKDSWPLYADKGQIHQVITNIVSNAAQAMPSGGVVAIETANEVFSMPEGTGSGRYLRITISDDGYGIPPAVLTRIFDPYFSLKPAGTGLGLTTAFSIVQRHGGSIRAGNRPGGGTRFDIYLPAAEEGAREESSAGTRGAASGSGSVLVMDDEEMIRSLAVAMLEELGYCATPCADGAEAVALYARSSAEGKPFDMVILDLTIPGGMGGKEAAALIRRIDPQARLIISSGYSHDVFDERDRLMFSAVVKKPYNLTRLADALAAVAPARHGSGAAESAAPPYADSTS